MARIYESKTLCLWHTTCHLSSKFKTQIDFKFARPGHSFLAYCSKLWNGSQSVSLTWIRLSDMQCILCTFENDIWVCNESSQNYDMERIQKKLVFFFQFHSSCFQMFICKQLGHIQDLNWDSRSIFKAQYLGTWNKSVDSASWKCQVGIIVDWNYFKSLSLRSRDRIHFERSPQEPIKTSRHCIQHMEIEFGNQSEPERFV